MLGAMGAGAVTAGFLMPSLRGRMNRSQIVWAASALSALAMAVIAAAALLGLGWVAAGVGIFLYGMAWLAAASTLQAAASLAAPNWVRARAMGIYQMGFFGAMTLGSAVAGWIGEHAGSGGALAISVADQLLMLQYSIYSVISPEGCASILWKTSERASDAADALGITAHRLKALGLVDKIVNEPVGGAHRDTKLMASQLKRGLNDAWRQVADLKLKELLDRRYERLQSYGRFTDTKAESR
jgi:MFS family permease